MYIALYQIFLLYCSFFNSFSVSVSFYYSQHLSLFQGVTDFLPRHNPLSPFHPVMGIFESYLKPTTEVFHHTFPSLPWLYPSSTTFNLKPPCMLNTFFIPSPNHVPRHLELPCLTTSTIVLTNPNLTINSFVLTPSASCTPHHSKHQLQFQIYS